MGSNIGKKVPWADMRAKMKDLDAECKSFQSLISRDLIFSKLENLDNGIRTWRKEDEDRHEIIVNLIEKWRKQMSGQFDKEAAKTDFIAKWLENLMNDRQACIDANSRIISWISDVQVGEAHSRIREKLGSQYWDTGKWFLAPPAGQNDPYQDWRKSLNSQIWIQGAPGTGKSSLESLVIHDLITNPASDNLAFYYCFRTATDSSNTPLAVMRSLVAQLAWSDDGMEVAEELRLRYQRESGNFVKGSKLSIDECGEILADLICLRGSTSIVVDALDECSAPMRVLACLRQVWKKTDCLKLFFTSRLHVEVNSPLAFPNATTVRAGSGSDSSSKDIKSFILRELAREERRNSEVITPELADRMVTILIRRAQGMYVGTF
jgi:hypothetical protein